MYKDEDRAGDHEVTELKLTTTSPSEKTVKENQINFTSRNKHFFSPIFRLSDSSNCPTLQVFKMTAFRKCWSL